MNISDLNKLINSELTTKIKNTNTENNELSIDVKVENLYQVILFLKSSVVFDDKHTCNLRKFDSSFLKGDTKN